MSEPWIRRRLTAELLSDAHLGSGSGGEGIDAFIARDRKEHPVIWASHLEGVLRDAARRLRGDQFAGDFFGRSGGQRQRAIFTSLYARERPESHIWTSTARESFANRSPKDETLRVVEYVPRGTRFEGEVELPESQLPLLERLLQEVDALGSGRANGAGRVKLSLADCESIPRKTGPSAVRLLLLLKNRDPLCITATATPDNLIPSLAYVPGRTLLGAIAAWLIAENDKATAALLTSGRISVADALPVPGAPASLETAEVLPAPLSLQSEKPEGVAGELPWWAQEKTATRRLDAWSEEAKELTSTGAKLKRLDEDLLVYRAAPKAPWKSFRPATRVRLRNGRPDSNKTDPLLFAIEQIVEETHFLTELSGTVEDMAKLANALAPVLEGRRWLRVGRAGAPVEVEKLAWSTNGVPKPTLVERGLLILTSDLLARDEFLRWHTSLDETVLKALGIEDVYIAKYNNGSPKALQDSVMIHGFNGTSRLWRMPAAAIRRGSVFEISGPGVAKLAERAAKDEWLGERTHEGFGRFRIDAVHQLPGASNGGRTGSVLRCEGGDADEEAIAATTQEWFNSHKALVKAGGDSRRPSLSQWFDFAAALERADATENESDRSDAHGNLLNERFNPSTAGAKGWKHQDAQAILEKLKAMEPAQRTSHTRLFVRWLRAVSRANQRNGAACRLD